MPCPTFPTLTHNQQGKIMEHSPGRELRNRVKQSPSSSPTRTRVRCSPNSSPPQTNKCQTNGVSKGKIPAIANVTTFDQDIVSPGDLQSNPIVILSSEGDCHGNQSHSKIDTTTSPFQKNDTLCPGNPALFPKTNIFIDNLTIDTLTKAGSIQNQQWINSLDINSNMDPGSKGDGSQAYPCFVYSNSAASGKHSRKQRSPKRARTALMNPVQRKSLPLVKILREDKSVPVQYKKCPRKISYVARSDSPTSEIIDLTDDIVTTEAFTHRTDDGQKSSSPLSSRSAKINQKTHSKIDFNVCKQSSSPIRSRSPRACKSTSPRSECKSRNSDKLLNKTLINSPKTDSSPSRNYTPKRGRSASYSPRTQRPKISDDSPNSKRRKISKDSPRNKRFMTADHGAKSPGRGRPRKIVDSPICNTPTPQIKSPGRGRPRKNIDSPKNNTTKECHQQMSPNNINDSRKEISAKKSSEMESKCTEVPKKISPNNKNCSNKAISAQNSPEIESQFTELPKKISPARRKLDNGDETRSSFDIVSSASNLMSTFMNFISASKSKSESLVNNKEEQLEVEAVKSKNNSLVEQCKDHDIQNKPFEIDTESPVKKKVESPVKVKVDSPVRVKVIPDAPSSDLNNPSSSNTNFDDGELLNQNDSTSKDKNRPISNEDNIKRRIVRPRKNLTRQRKNSGGRGRHSTGRKKKVSASPCKFQKSQEVLARWYDGLFYLGSVIKVDERGRKCFVKFEDDSEYWILFKDLQKGAKEGDVSCCLCQTDGSDKPNEIVLCDNCGLGYHQECHNPNIDSDVLQPDIEWCCRLCVFAAAVKKGGALKNGPDAKALQKMKQTFPYDINKLTWDAQHKTNVEQCYCYCGGPGNWFLKMLQCCRCRQWFHEACIQCLEYPLMNGDRFYLFVCSHCNTGPEYIKRLDLKWVDVVHLTLYNLTMEGRWNKFYDVDDVKDFITSNWEMLQVHCLSEDKDSIRDKVVSSLERYKSRFINQKENKKKTSVKSSYCLRVRIPPPAPTVMLPHTGQINHEIMMSLKEKGKNFKCFVPTQCNSPVSVPWQNKRKGLEMDVSIAFKSDKFRRNILQSTGESLNQDYKGYTGEQCLSSQLLIKQHSLDDLIPTPNNFEGFNHPFKNFYEQEEELAHHKRKNEIINYLYMNYECDDDVSQSSADSTTFDLSRDDPTKAIPTPPPSVTSGGNCTQETNKDLRSKGRKRKAMDTPTEPLRQSKRKKTTTACYNVVDIQAIESFKSQPVCMSQIKNNMCQYFGAAESIKRGEKYNVLGKHVTSDGKIKYLIQWDGLQTK